ncbi:MAG: M23 family metallopeptidase [Oscillospiraceae bacterium]
MAAVRLPLDGCNPLPYRVAVTSAYGYRVHPVTGAWSFHTGVDLGAAEGTPIYATRSGTVTTATYSDVYGNYVTINHGDGYSSLYGHMTHYVVSAGEYVSQGEVIGYVGSTGWSTGPHLHFTIYYNGSTVNPMDYI